MIRVGRYEISSAVLGTFRLDGGAMFGVVPKVLWAPGEDVDGDNRILLAMRTLIAVDRAAGRVILVDTGAGNKWSAKDSQRFALNTDPDALDQALAQRGLTADDVTDVVVTHLHFDHNGGVVKRIDGPHDSADVRFRGARHWLHRRHWEHVQHPTSKDRASFWPTDFTALADADVLELVDGDEPASTIDGVRWVVSHGHTAGQLLPVFEGEDGDLMFVGDMIPTTSHLRPPWVMAYDLYPLTTIEEKQRVLARCKTDKLLLAFPHDRRHGGVRVEFPDDKPSAPRVARALDL